ncbi:MAG: nitrophenyl compound nitroreductase subunit ArsF family protein [Flavobacteriales bacterium]
MKHLFHLSFLALGLLVSACNSNAQQPAKSANAAGATRIDVIDFHTDHRCKTCLTIQSLTEEVLNSNYAAEKKAGTITFRTVNVDEAANAKLAEDFGAYGTALFLHVHKNGKAEKIDLTEWAFMKAGNADAFKSELARRIKELL